MTPLQVQKGVTNLVEAIHNALYGIRGTAGGDGARVPELTVSGRFHVESGALTDIQVTAAVNDAAITAAVEAPTVEADTQTDHTQRQVQNSGTRTRETEQDTS